MKINEFNINKKNMVNVILYEELENWALKFVMLVKLTYFNDTSLELTSLVKFLICKIENTMYV